ncbi:MAG: hypothetical protein JJT76_10875 [Clostridiaceae bacterium]|nr:hypothetical protein [Clostridiaceae bacterium]
MKKVYIPIIACFFLIIYWLSGIRLTPENALKSHRLLSNNIILHNIERINSEHYGGIFEDLEKDKYGVVEVKRLLKLPLYQARTASIQRKSVDERTPFVMVGFGPPQIVGIKILDKDIEYLVSGIALYYRIPIPIYNKHELTLDKVLEFSGDYQVKNIKGEYVLFTKEGDDFSAFNILGFNSTGDLVAYLLEGHGSSAIYVEK